ncbi:PPA1309 family protein [Corynebacterium heidelbergense]|uniref:Uncharacterized protein n=1 Tax=Corynebacterium heidelbergense TaxID=2055947 RepID=A0A364VA89_9CORY|nr:PPA1309 family protein [Corynebacterium heidelbergense]RAV33559.1 hypothetical protein CWC39_07830 [Corynebacterium heidelbergense]WCZ37157.1 hypothetical protein CHEID_08135 [Corynebacterium heidelbergense]
MSEFFHPVDIGNPRVLNAAVLEAVDFVQAEGWDRPPSLFALVPLELVSDAVDLVEDPDRRRRNPLALVLQEDIPEHIPPGSEELGEFIAAIRWPKAVVGAVLAQEIRFVNSASDAVARPARLFSGILDDAGTGPELTLVQLRPSAEELEQDLFAQDRVELLGGENLAPGVTAALRASFDPD